MNVLFTDYTKAERFFDGEFDRLRAKVELEIAEKFKAAGQMSESTMLDLIRETVLRVLE